MRLFDKFKRTNSTEMRLLDKKTRQGVSMLDLLNSDNYLDRMLAISHGYGLDKGSVDKVQDVRQQVDIYLADNDYKSLNEWKAKNTDKCVLKSHLLKGVN